MEKENWEIEFDSHWRENVSPFFHSDKIKMEVSKPPVKIDELKDVVLSKEEQVIELKRALEAVKKINDILDRAVERRNTSEVS